MILNSLICTQIPETKPFFRPIDSLRIPRHQQLVDSKEYPKVGRTRETSLYKFYYSKHNSLTKPKLDSK
jgi:hypothetical protein